MGGSRENVFVVLVVVSLLLVAAAPVPAESSAGVVSVEAVFEGRPIDLTRGWGEAQACLYWPEATSVVECFRSEAEMDARLDVLHAGTEVVAVAGLGGGTFAASSCSGYLRLYDGTGYGTPVFYLASRFQWINMASFGWDQRTSSFKVGPCSAYFADFQNGGGGWYPTYLTEAYDKAWSMISGWDNDVSSVYIS